MFEAQILHTGDTVYSPWFPRQGDNAIFTLEVVTASGTSPDLLVQVFTKNSEDGGDGVDSDNGGSTKISRSTAGRSSTEWISKGLTPGLEEMVRYKFTVTGTSAKFLFRMLPPVWFDSIDAS